MMSQGTKLTRGLFSLHNLAVELEGKYRFGILIYAFDDHALSREFQRVFRLKERRSDQTIGSFHFARISYSAFVLTSTFGHKLSGNLESLLGVIDAFLEDFIRSQANISTCSIHAATSVVSGDAISCIGESGSGKTTLSLSLAAGEGCGYLGDEYAFLDLNTGIISHEKTPIHIKQDSFLAKTECIHGGLPLQTLSRYGVLSNMYASEDFGVNYYCGSVALKAIVFPQYLCTNDSPVIQQVPLRSLPDLLMPSVAGPSMRAELFCSLVKLIGEKDIVLYSLKYGDAKEAARALLSRMDLENRVNRE